MASCRSTITAALRKIGVVAAGREPRSTDTYDALSSLQSLYMGLIDVGAFGRLRDVVPLTDYTANENERVFRQNDGCSVVSLPELVADDWLADCQDAWGPLPSTTTSNCRPPRDLSVVVIIDAFVGSTSTWIYDGARKQWVALDALQLDDLAPLSTRNPDGLAALLAMQIVDQFGGDMPQTTMRNALAFQSSLVTRFSMERTEAPGVYV